MHVRRGIDRRRALLDRQQQLRFRDTLRADVGDRLDLRQPRPPPDDRDVERQPIAGQHLPAELRVVHPAQGHARCRRHVAALEEKHRGKLRERLDGQDRGHNGRTGKVSRKEIFVDREILEGREPAARLMLPDRVDQERRKTVMNAVEERREIERHLPTFSAPAPGSRAQPDAAQAEPPDAEPGRPLPEQPVAARARRRQPQARRRRSGGSPRW